MGEAMRYKRIAGINPTANCTVDMNVMSDQELLKIQLEELKREHRALDTEILASQPEVGMEPLDLKRMKKRKLLLRDRITRIEDQLYPDIIA
ncbi:MAG: YdcH family protein [Paracoccaceae bacterium]